MHDDLPFPVFPALFASAPVAFFCRRAESGDFPNLRELEWSCFDPDRRDSPSVIRRSIVNPRHEVWVVVNPSAAKLAGAIFLRLKGRTLRLHSLAVDPECQRRGIGRTLLAWALSLAALLGAHRMVIEVDVALPTLVKWYERQGFRNLCRLWGYYGPGRDACRMEREILR